MSDTSSSFFKRHERFTYLVSGFLLGLLLGATIPYSLRGGAAPGLAVAEIEAQRALLDDVEARVETTLTALSIIENADVRLTVAVRPTRFHSTNAVIIVTPASDLEDDALSPEQIGSLCGLVVASVDGLNESHVWLIDDAGQELNTGRRRANERKVFWTGIAINVAKVLGVLAALITLRFIIEAVGKGGEGAEAEK